MGPPKQRSLIQEAWSQLSPDEAKTTRTRRWQDRLVSLWAPVTVLAAFFGVYLTLVELSVCVYPWLQPVMQGLGLLCFAWWVCLWLVRLPWLKAWNSARVARSRAEEQLLELNLVAQQARNKLKEKAWEDLVAACRGLLVSFCKTGPEIQAASVLAEQVYDKHLKPYKRGLADAGGGFAKALLIALLFRAVLLDPFKIPSGSMIPTFELGDQIFVNKFLYGVRIPFTNVVPFVIVRPPKRGDVIVFNNPVRPEVDFIKRVVGIPGDTLGFDEEGLRINGQLAPRTLESDEYSYWEHNEVQVGMSPEMLQYWISTWTNNDWYQRPESVYRETFDGVPHLILDEPSSRRQTLARMGSRTSVTVPDGHVFVMGDNRNNSADSRFGLGQEQSKFEFVPFGSIKGKATVIWLSLSHGGFLSSIFGGTGIRYDRFFLPVTMCGSEAPRK